MPKSLTSLIASIIFCLAASRPAFADTQFGIQAIEISGTHFEPKGNVSGSAVGGFISLDQRWRAIQLHFEGFPSVGTATVQTASGPAHATLGIFGATVRFRID